MGPPSQPPPVAVIRVTSPVSVGQGVGYQDLSYDPAAGHVIVYRQWSGRQGSFSSPGVYTVELWVMDDRALWGFASATVVVTASRPPVRKEAWQVEVPSGSVPRGGAIPIRVTGSVGGPVRMRCPSAFLLSVPVGRETVDYGRLNATPFQAISGGVGGVLYVPWTQTTPSDGKWTIILSDGVSQQAVTVTVKGTLQMEPSVRSFSNGR